MVDFSKMSVGQRVKYLIEVEKLFNQARLAALIGVSAAGLNALYNSQNPAASTPPATSSQKYHSGGLEPKREGL